MLDASRSRPSDTTVHASRETEVFIGCPLWAARHKISAAGHRYLRLTNRRAALFQLCGQLRRRDTKHLRATKHSPLTDGFRCLAKTLANARFIRGLSEFSRVAECWYAYCGRGCGRVRCVRDCGWGLDVARGRHIRAKSGAKGRRAKAGRSAGDEAVAVP